jgi:hypothetical protein
MMPDGMEEALRGFQTIGSTDWFTLVFTKA